MISQITIFLCVWKCLRLEKGYVLRQVQKILYNACRFRTHVIIMAFRSLMVKQNSLIPTCLSFFNWSEVNLFHFYFLKIIKNLTISAWEKTVGEMTRRLILGFSGRKLRPRISSYFSMVTNNRMRKILNLGTCFSQCSLLSIVLSSMEVGYAEQYSEGLQFNPKDK